MPHLRIEGLDDLRNRLRNKQDVIEEGSTKMDARQTEIFRNTLKELREDERTDFEAVREELDELQLDMLARVFAHISYQLELLEPVLLEAYVNDDKKSLSMIMSAVESIPQLLLMVAEANKGASEKNRTACNIWDRLGTVKDMSHEDILIQTIKGGLQALRNGDISLDELREVIEHMAKIVGAEVELNIATGDDGERNDPDLTINMN